MPSDKAFTAGPRSAARQDQSGPSTDPKADAQTDIGSEVGERGTPLEALAVPEFRRLFLGTSLSNTGRWLQTAALGVLGWKISESSAYLGLLIFAHLAPLGLLSLVGGSLADSRDRRKLLLIAQSWQMFWTLVLAAMLIDGDISQTALLLIVFVIGLGQGLYSPTITSVLPAIAGQRNLNAAVALNSMQINATRIVGPSIGGLMVSHLGFSEVFLTNALSYSFVLYAVWRAKIPNAESVTRDFRSRIFGGFTIAKRAPQVGRPLIVMCLFSFFCLPYIGQLPAIAELNLGIESQSSTYGWFYACFGVGALIGATLVGTVFLNVAVSRIAPISLIGFAATLAALAYADTAWQGFVAILVNGAFYFSMPTALAGAWQEHVDSDIRGRVAALWVLAFGGTIPVANIIAGWVIEATSLFTVMISGAVSALALALITIPSGPVVNETILEG